MFATFLRCKINFGHSSGLNIFKRCFMHKGVRHPGMPLKFEPKVPGTTKKKVFKKIAVPEGYKLIYCNGYTTLTNFGQCVVAAGIALTAYIVVCCCTDLELLNKEYKFGEINPLMGLLVGGTALVAHVLLTRQVQLIYVKNKQYVTVMNGVLGALRRKHIRHTASDVVPFGIDNIFYLNKKIVVIFPDHFLDMNDYWDLCEGKEEEKLRTNDDTGGEKMTKKDK